MGVEGKHSRSVIRAGLGLGLLWIIQSLGVVAVAPAQEPATQAKSQAELEPKPEPKSDSRRATVRDHRTRTSEAAARTRDRRARDRHTRTDSQPRIRDHRTSTVPPPRHRPGIIKDRVKGHLVTGVYEAVVLKPRDTKPPEALRQIVDHGPISRAGDFSFETLQDNFWSGTRRNEVYYLPRAFRLARTAGGYGLSAVWTTDQKILLTVNLRADVDPEELAYAESLIQAREGAAKRLLPMPYQGAELVDLEVMEGWRIDRIQAPSFASLRGDLPLAFEMSAASFANLKPLLETEGLGAAMVVESGDLRFEVDVKISLRDPSGRAYSPLADVRVGYDPEGSALIFDGVVNRLDFPVAVEAVDVLLEDDAWAAAEVHSGLRPLDDVVLEPGARGRIAVALPPSSTLARTSTLSESRPESVPSGARRDGEGRSRGESILRDLIGGLLESEGLSIPDGAGGRDRDTDIETRSGVPISLDGVARRYRLRLVPDFGCQSCYDQIWGDLEVVSYLERLRRLRVEVLASAFESDYDGHRLDAVTVDLRSRHFSPKSEARRGLHSVSLAPDRPLDESIAIFLPVSNQPLGLDYRVTARLSDGRVWRGQNWSATEDSLHLLIGAGEIRVLANE